VRFVRIIAGLFIICILPSALGQGGVTITQLRDFLLTQHKSRQSDIETAERLSSVTLAERLNEQALSRIITEAMPGPESLEQLRLLADYSIFAAPPTSGESSISPAPSPEEQQQMVGAGAEYAQTALHHLPDFMAIRYTRRFDNTPLGSGHKHAKPKILLHWIGEFKDRITYRNGAEIENDSRTQQGTSEIVHPGLMSMGEFGPILSVVFRDFATGDVAWARWELDDPAEGRLAVFHYSVPKAASHYLVDFCCYRNPEDETEELSFHDHPAYHGEVVLNPDSGVVRRITIQADLDNSAPVFGSDLVVRYREVEIGGRAYVCPVRSIAMTTIHNAKMERIDGLGIERHLNEVQYIDYHKFGSTSRVVADP
jgi:hypothetical protein